MSVYRDPPHAEAAIEMKPAITKTIKVDERHFIELALAGNGQLYLTLKCQGLMANDSNWSSYDWFMSQLSFPPTQFPEIERVVKRWLTTYVREYEAGHASNAIELALRDLTKSEKKSKGN